MFDVDGDGHLNEAEVRLMVESMVEVAAQTRAQDSEPAADTLDCDTLVRGLLPHARWFPGGRPLAVGGCRLVARWLPAAAR